MYNCIIWNCKNANIGNSNDNNSLIMVLQGTTIIILISGMQSVESHSFQQKPWLRLKSQTLGIVQEGSKSRVMATELLANFGKQKDPGAGNMLSTYVVDGLVSWHNVAQRGTTWQYWRKISDILKTCHLLCRCWTLHLQNLSMFRFLTSSDIQWHPVTSRQNDVAG